jgi:hypothetical protein
MKTSHENQFKFIHIYFVENWTCFFIEPIFGFKNPWISWCCVFLVVLLMWGFCSFFCCCYNILFPLLILLFSFYYYSSPIVILFLLWLLFSHDATFLHDEVIEFLIIKILKYFLIIGIFNNRFVKINCYCICENYPTWKSNEFEKIKNLTT